MFIQFMSLKNGLRLRQKEVRNQVGGFKFFKNFFKSKSLKKRLKKSLQKSLQKSLKKRVYKRNLSNLKK